MITLSLSSWANAEKSAKRHAAIKKKVIFFIILINDKQIYSNIPVKKEPMLQIAFLIWKNNKPKTVKKLWTNEYNSN
ncbi:hypothetical protein GCM10023115_41860 [Pontixanthobacter gangjinensis]